MEGVGRKPSPAEILRKEYKRLLGRTQEFSRALLFLQEDSFIGQTVNLSPQYEMTTCLHCKGYIVACAWVLMLDWSQIGARLAQGSRQIVYLPESQYKGTTTVKWLVPRSGLAGYSIMELLWLCRSNIHSGHIGDDPPKFSRSDASIPHVQP